MNHDKVHVTRGVAQASRVYPDDVSARDAINLFHARVQAIAREMGAHGVFAVAEFEVEKVRGRNTEAQCVVAYGCLSCLGAVVQHGIEAVVEHSPQFMVGLLARMVKSMDGRRQVSEAMAKVAKEGYQA